jgi:hypothetical protein
MPFVSPGCVPLLAVATRFQATRARPTPGTLEDTDDVAATDRIALRHVVTFGCAPRDTGRDRSRTVPAPVPFWTVVSPTRETRDAGCLLRVDPARLAA